MRQAGPTAGSQGETSDSHGSQSGTETVRHVPDEQASMV